MNVSSSSTSASAFDWPLCYEAERIVAGFIEAFHARNSVARSLAQRMRDETGTDFFEWVDHLRVAEEHGAVLRAAGFVEECVAAPVGCVVLHHPRATMPRVLLTRESPATHPVELALRPEHVADFVAAHGVEAGIEGAPLVPYRRVLVSEEGGARLIAVERLAHRGFVVEGNPPGRASAILRAREVFRTRKRRCAKSGESVRHSFAALDQALALVGRDVACQLFFEFEREYWENRNSAARVQLRRQAALGLGWGNHDHHTFRCSRAHFVDLVEFLLRLGFEKRERYYAGAEAGWGAQILEQSVAGIVVFADVDLMADETAVDFSQSRLPLAPRLGTVGLWCALHGDSFLDAGMHHLEARFDFARLRDQLAAEGIGTMRPFSDFEFLRQAFTEGERWRVDPVRVRGLLEAGLITREQHDTFVRDGAIGSHLENLQRHGGFKGFNQKSVSAIISATDPRAMQAAVAQM